MNSDSSKQLLEDRFVDLERQVGQGLEEVDKREPRQREVHDERD